MNDYVEVYSQMAPGHPDTVTVPADNVQKVDLTEFYKETDQDVATAMVTGAESLLTGRLSRAVALQLSLKGASSFDDFASERNAVAGQEGFFSAIRDGFKDFIEKIIKYVRMVITWIVETIQTVFGFRKTKRVNSEINKSLDDMKQEFTKTLNGMGMPGKEYNLENFIGEMPKDTDRMAQLVLMKSKFETDQQAIDGLYEAVPLIQSALVILKNSSDKALRTAETMKRVIGQEYTKTRVRASDPNMAVPASDSPELLMLVKACQETTLALDTDTLASAVGKVYNALYKVNFTNQELKTGFDEVRKKLQLSIETEHVNLRKVDGKALLTSIGNLNSRYMELSDNHIDPRDIDIRKLGGVINIDDANKVKQIADYYQAQQLIQVYQQAVVDIRNFTQFCLSTMQSLMTTERQISNLSDWYNRAHSYYYAGLLGDMETCVKINLEARDKGFDPLANKDGHPVGMVVISDADAKTFGEKFGVISKNILSSEADMGSYLQAPKTSLANFKKQAGW